MGGGEEGGGGVTTGASAGTENPEKVMVP